MELERACYWIRRLGMLVPAGIAIGRSMYCAHRPVGAFVRQVYCTVADTFTLIRLLKCAKVTRLRRRAQQLTASSCWSTASLISGTCLPTLDITELRRAARRLWADRTAGRDRTRPPSRDGKERSLRFKDILKERFTSTGLQLLAETHTAKQH